MPRCAKCGEVYDDDLDGCPDCTGHGCADTLEGCGKYFFYAIGVLILVVWLASMMRG